MMRWLSTAASELEKKSRRQIIRETPVDQAIWKEIEAFRLGKRKPPKASYKRRMHKARQRPPQLELEGRERDAYVDGAILTGYWDSTEGDKLHTMWPNKFSDAPEVAFIGRSNVGKSSFLNSFLGLGSRLAKVEDRPGTTLRVGRYVLRSGALGFLDVPGYGFAYSGGKHWDAAFEFLQERVEQGPLVRLLVLLDARHGFKKADWDIVQQLERVEGLVYQFILNKCDLVEPRELAKRALLTRESIKQHGLRATSRILMVSAYQQRGITAVHRELLPLAGNFETKTSSARPKRKQRATGNFETKKSSVRPRRKERVTGNFETKKSSARPERKEKVTGSFETKKSSVRPERKLKVTGNFRTKKSIVRPERKAKVIGNFETKKSSVRPKRKERVAGNFETKMSSVRPERKEKVNGNFKTEKSSVRSERKEKVIGNFERKKSGVRQERKEKIIEISRRKSQAGVQRGKKSVQKGMRKRKPRNPRLQTH